MSAADFDRLSPKDTAATLLGRTDDGRLVAVAKRPASHLWLVRVDPDTARTTAGQVARHHLDASNVDVDVWQVPHPYAERLVAALASTDPGDVLALVADVIRNTTKN